MGKKLAAKLGYNLVDLDHEIEHVTGTTVAGYFASHGEDEFRKLESDTLKNHEYADNAVISTGGGTPCFFDNMDWMNENGITIYIQLPAISLAKRLEKGIDKRPLLRNLSEKELVQFIEGKLEERDPFYSKAKVTLSGIGLNADTIRAAVERLS